MREGQRHPEPEGRTKRKKEKRKEGISKTNIERI